MRLGVDFNHGWLLAAVQTTWSFFVRDMSFADLGPTHTRHLTALTLP
jgi:hypothetical protein